MAQSGIVTHLTLDDYAKIMAIPGWLFNQVTHPKRDQRGLCSDIWFQSGYFSDPNRILGRDELAQAIAVTERQVGNMLGFPFAPTYICGDERNWPVPKRGSQLVLPLIRASWGQIIQGGIEQWNLLGTGDIIYTDEDDDGILDWATVTIDVTAYGLTCEDNECEIEIVPPGKHPAANWSIRPLKRSCSGGILTLSGPRWLFVGPKYWLQLVEMPLDEDNYFLGQDIYPYEGGIQVYRHWTDPSQQAQIVWKGSGCSTICVDVCQEACLTVQNKRLGQVTVQPAVYNAVSGQWSTSAWSVCEIPAKVRLWYLAGFEDNACINCNQLGPLIREALVRLTNTHLPEAPCGCDPTRERWTRDREEMSVDSQDVELAQAAFGSTMRGAIFAYNVFSKLPPLGRGG